MSALNQDRIEAFFDEFPFLQACIERNRVSSVKVARIDLKLLAFRPEYMTTPGEYSGIRFMKDQRMLLLDKDGHLVQEVRPDRRRPTNYRWWKPSTWLLSKGETVEECLKSLGEVISTIEFAVLDHIPILWVATDRDNEREVIVYKKPRDVRDLGQWLRDQIETVRQETKTSS